MGWPVPIALTLCTAALGFGPAEARDLEKALITPSVMPCPSKGAGFVRLPGSASCIRVSGRVTAGADLRGGHGIGAPATPPVTGRLAIDNRADTDLGEVRTYVRIGNGRR